MKYSGTLATLRQRGRLPETEVITAKRQTPIKSLICREPLPLSLGTVATTTESDSPQVRRPLPGRPPRTCCLRAGQRPNAHLWSRCLFELLDLLQEPLDRGQVLDLLEGRLQASDL